MSSTLEGVAEPTTSAIGQAQRSQGLTLVAFFAAVAFGLILFAVQSGTFLVIRHGLARIYQPKTEELGLVPLREQTRSPPLSPWNLLRNLTGLKDREIMRKCGLDAYFFLRYLQTLLVIFVPTVFMVMPVLIPLNFVGGIGRSVVDNRTATDAEVAANITGLDTLAWSNISPHHHDRYWAHLLMALLVIVWFCFVVFAEMRVYIKIRQDYLTTAEHRLRASASTVLVSSIPDKWLSEEALKGLFDVFPGGVKNIWLSRDYSRLLEKISLRDKVHGMLEASETELIQKAKKKQRKSIAKKQRMKAPEEDRRAKDRARDVNAGMSTGEPPALWIGKEDVEMLACHGGKQSPVTGVRPKGEPKGEPKGDMMDEESGGSGLASDTEGVIPGIWGGNKTRQYDRNEKRVILEGNRLKFWEPPAGGFASPIPQGYNRHKVKKARLWDPVLKLFASDDEQVGYPTAFEQDYNDQGEISTAWQKWLRKSDRPHHRVWNNAPAIWGRRVDSIYWCRAELARLNLEIEEDQKNYQRFPKLNSAFIQFEHQIAAHMACQSVSHHVPNSMAPRILEIDPRDVIWENMAIRWFDEWARKTIVLLIAVGMTILWAFPVAWTASLAKIDDLVRRYPWLDFLQQNRTVLNTVRSIAGLLPAGALLLLLWLVPRILELLASFQGAKTGSQRSEVVQVYYFVFLFIQVFLVVSISSSTFEVIAKAANNFTSTTALLANNLPKSADYFFSYMIIQALSTSSGTLLQIGSLFNWYVMQKFFDTTARQRYRRWVELPQVSWGSLFPVYTNFACIGLIYSVIAPIICVFAIVTFSLLWFAHRYNMMYVNRFGTDTGGVLYPRALNQTFVGLYVMELCLIGLFFLVADEHGRKAAIPQASIMIATFVATATYQILLNKSFSPLFRYLPITFEDEAVLRDKAFEDDRRERQEGQERQARRAPAPTAPDDPDDKIDTGHPLTPLALDEKVEPGVQDMPPAVGSLRRQPSGRVKRSVHSVRSAGSWARNTGHATFRGVEKRFHAGMARQRGAGHRLFVDLKDEIEEIEPKVRDALVQRAFEHSALRARRPAVWIPNDDIGVSEDEIKQTALFSPYIWISNQGAALDSANRVVYGKNRVPPDFLKEDLIKM